MNFVSEVEGRKKKEGESVNIYNIYELTLCLLCLGRL